MVLIASDLFIDPKCTTRITTEAFVAEWQASHSVLAVSRATGLHPEAVRIWLDSLAKLKAIHELRRKMR